MSYDFSGKRIAVVGIARSGMASAEALSQRGAKVTLYDAKPKDQLPTELAWASERNIPVVASAEEVRPADIAVISPGVRPASPIIKSIRGQNIELWGEVEAAYRISEAPILAVTGTNGKTTTVLLLAEMLRAGGVTTFAAGNIAAGTLAQPLIAAANSAAAGNAIVAEISSFQLETIHLFRPAVAAVLNITPDHQDRQTWEEYIAAKWRIFENQRDNDTAVLSTDLPVPVNSPHLPPNVVYFDRIPHPTWIDQITLLGKHSRLNVLAASVMASSFGIAEAAIKDAAVSFRGVVHRLEFVAEVDGVVYINNSMCTNNAAFASSLEALDGSKVVICGGVFKGGEMTTIADAVAQNHVKLVVTFGRSGPDIADVIRRHTDVLVIVVETLSDAVDAATQKSGSGDKVVLNPGCASFDQFKDFEQRGDDFKQLINSLRKVTSK